MMEGEFLSMNDPQDSQIETLEQKVPSAGR